MARRERAPENDEPEDAPEWQEEAQDDAQPGTSRGMGRATKRTRREEQTFARGTVKEVRVHNFMTYHDATIRPGPRLNLVLGPNGTGKSSLVCALCIGLAGKPKLLGRADQLASFVRRGQTEAWTEITLAGGPGAPDQKVRREIELVYYTDESGERKMRPESAWKVNGAPKIEKDVAALVRNMNIQFENLCQFLPQDKVVEFAQMNPGELLTATEKAIGDATLHEQHMKLIELRNQQKEAQANHAFTLTTLTNKRSQLDAIERDYQRFQQREACLEQVAILEHRERYLRADEARDKMQRSANFLAKAEELLEKKKKEGVGADVPDVRQLKKKSEKAAADATKLQKDVRDADQKAHTLQARVRALNSDIDDKIGAKAGLAKQSQDWRKKIAEGEAAMAKLQADLTALGPTPPLQTPEFDEWVRQHGAMSSQAASMWDLAEQHKEGALRCLHDIGGVDRQLSQLDSHRQQRLIHLEHKRRGTRAAHDWVQQQRAKGTFRGQVYGPVALDITVTQPELIHALEMQIGQALGAFVVENREDQAVLERAFREKHYTGFVACYVGRVDQPVEYPKGHASEYAEWGVRCTLDQAIEAPPLVKAFLVADCRLNTAFAGPVSDVRRFNAATNGKVDLVYTPDERVTVIRGRYHDTRSFKHDAIVPAVALPAGAGAGAAAERQRLLEQKRAIQQAHDQLDAEQRGAQVQARALEEQAAELAAHIAAARQAHEQERAKRQRLSNDAKAKGALLAQVKSKPDPLAQAPALQRQLDKLADDLLQTLQQLIAAGKEQLLLKRAADIATLTRVELDMLVAALSAAAEAAAKELEELNKKRDNLQRLHDADKVAYQDRLAAAEAACPLTPEVAEKFRALPGTLSEVQKAIKDKTEEANAIVCANPEVAAQYQALSGEVADMEAVAAANQQRVEQQAAAIQQLRDQWLPELRRIVTKVNETFSANFVHVGCAGEVLLQEDEDFDKFAIAIRVKFREAETLQLLNANRQSGGERSVSTILYLIALQGVTVTPFRVVDEINQGMDPINERKIFTQLVRAACRPGTPQCFLLTPKLLPDLPFTDDITVLNIFNGAAVEAATARSYSIDALFGGAEAMRRLAEAQA